MMRGIQKGGGDKRLDATDGEACRWRYGWAGEEAGRQEGEEAGRQVGRQVGR